MVGSTTTQAIQQLEVLTCDDCNRKGIEFVSLRMGTLLCTDCASAHSFMGPSVSLIHHLRNGTLDEEHVQLVQAMRNANVNMIWESALLDGSKKKAEIDRKFVNEHFVIEKYQHKAFFPKRGNETEAELNNQLLACSRSNQIQVTLRLIALGADVNHADPETGDTPLHVAARENAHHQVEILFLYGANLLALNKERLTPIMIAQKCENVKLNQRMRELPFHINRMLLYYVTRKNLDFSDPSNRLLRLPELSSNRHTGQFCREISEWNLETFLSVSVDVYDEIIRRENYKILCGSNDHQPLQKTSAPFLPADPAMSIVRNQRRQKLAKYTNIQFFNLVIDLLNDHKRRLRGEPPKPALTPQQNKSRNFDKRQSNRSDQEYDEVARQEPTSSNEFSARSNNSELIPQEENHVMDEVLELREKVVEMELVTSKLVSQNESLTRIVHTLQKDNLDLRSKMASFDEAVERINRQNLSRRAPSPMISVDSTDRMSQERNIPVVRPATTERAPPPDNFRPVERPSRFVHPVQQSRSRFAPPVPINGGASPRSSSSERRLAASAKKLSNLRTIEAGAGPSSLNPRSSSGSSFTGEDLALVIQQGDVVTQNIRALLLQDQNGTLEANAAFCGQDIVESINKLITMFPNTVSTERVHDMIKAVMYLNDKCRSTHIVPTDVIDAAQLVAEKLRLVLLGV